MKKLWPFPGDSPIARARKMCLAYRALAESAFAEKRDAQSLLAKIPDPAIRHSNPSLADEINKHLMGALGSDQVADLDKRFADWGERWHTPQVAYEEDDLVTCEEGAKLIQMSAQRLARLRLTGKVDAISVGGGEGNGRQRFLFRVGDLYRLSSEVRTRQARSTVKLPDQENSAP